MRGRGVKFVFVSLVVLAGSFMASRLRGFSKVSFEENQPSRAGSYRALQPIKSGDLTIFPVVRNSESPKPTGWQYVTLDEGLKSGEVVVTEAGRVRGLIRNRRPGVWYPPESGDQVNQLVLLNNSSKPLVLLAGEIVTGGKQDRVIARDRIVPPKAILSIFLSSALSLAAGYKLQINLALPEKGPPASWCSLPCARKQWLREISKRYGTL